MDHCIYFDPIPQRNALSEWSVQKARFERKCQRGYEPCCVYKQRAGGGQRLYPSRKHWYYLSFTGGENTYYSYSDGGYSHIEYGDEIVFEVMQDDGFVRLYARVEE